jgi:hypothetical protein
MLPQNFDQEFLRTLFMILSEATVYNGNSSQYPPWVIGKKIDRELKQE